MLSVATTVLNYESWADTARCLKALRSSTYRQQWITVVDNGSIERPDPDQQNALVGTTFIEVLENIGYAAGNNRGIQVGIDRDADLFLVVNPDLLVEPETIATLVSAMTAHPEAGIVGPRIVNGGSEPLSVWFNGADVDRSTGNTRVRDLGVEAASLNYKQPVPTDYVTGACLLVRREVFEDIGPFPSSTSLTSKRLISA